MRFFPNHGHNWPLFKIFSQQKICSNMPALGSELWPLIFSWHLHVNCKFFLTFKKTLWVSRVRLSKGLHPSLIHEIEPDKHSIYWMPRAWDNGRRWFPFEKLAEIVRDPFWWAHLTFIHLFILLIHNEYLIYWFKLWSFNPFSCPNDKNKMRFINSLNKKIRKIFQNQKSFLLHFHKMQSNQGLACTYLVHTAKVSCNSDS